MNSRTVEIIFAIALLAIVGFLFTETFQSGRLGTGAGGAGGSVFYPRILLIVLALLALGVIAQALLTPPQPLKPFMAGTTMPVFGTIALTIIYAVLFSHVPFVPGAIAYCALMALTLGYRRFIALTATLLVVPLTLYGVFQLLLGSRLP